MTIRPQLKKGFRLIGTSGKLWAKELLSMLPDSDLTITVTKAKKKRSSQQNRWYWGICLPMIKEALIANCGIDGLSMNEAHEFLKRKFLKGREIVTEGGGAY